MHDETAPPDQDPLATAAIGPESPTEESSPGGAPTSEHLQRGTIVDRYVVLDLLGAGGMGVVYTAYDPELGRRVALKLLQADGKQTTSSRGEARLLREARALAQLKHANVISVYDVGVVGHRVFVAMELIAGCTLAEWLRSRPKSMREVVAKFLQAAQGLAAVHAAGLVHRDFKPSNVQVAEDGRVYLLDFGLARLSDAEFTESTPAAGHTPPSESATSAEPLSPEPLSVEPLSPSSGSELDANLTAVGKLLGTPAYLPPEAWDGRGPDPRRDQFSFCLALFEALAGAHPFPHWRERHALSRWRLAEPPKFLALPRWLRRAVLRGLERDPDRRHASMDALIEELSRGLRQTRRSLILLGIGMAALGGAIAARAIARPTAPVCADAGSDIEGVWGPAVKARTRASFDQLGNAFARDAFVRASSMMDTWADTWRAMREEACVATRVRHNQSEEVLSRRYACLDRRLVELRALTDVLAEVDEHRVRQAVKAAQSLTPLDVCTNTTALASSVNEPERPEHKASVAQARALLARAKALVGAGREVDALPILETVRAEGERLPFRPLEAEALVLRAHAEMKLGRDSEASTTLDKAILAAEASGDDVSRASAAAILVVNNARLADETATRRAERHARAWLERIGGDGRLESRIEGGLGILYYMKGTFGESVVHHQKSLDLLKGTAGDRDPGIPIAHFNIAGSLAYLGRYAEGIWHVEEALAALDATVGPEHPDRAMAASRLAEIYLRLGRRAQARPHLERALALHDGRDAFTAGPLMLFAVLFDENGEHTEALRYAQDAHAIFQRTDGPEAPLALDTLSLIGTVLRHLGRNAEALEVHRKVLTAFESTPGNDDTIIGLAYAELARDLEQNGNRAEAKATFEKALGLHRKRQASGETRFEIAAGLEGFGNLELDGETPASALPRFREALELVAPQLGADAPALVPFLTGLGRAHLAAGAPGEALPVLQRAEKLLSGERWPERTLGQLRFALAEALLATGAKEERSLALAAEAERHFRAAGLPRRAASVGEWRRDRRRAKRGK